MNKKVDVKFIGIKDIYQLQCLCTELNDEVKRLNKRNEILSKELTKDKILHQDKLTTCCGIPIEEIPDLINKVDILQKENTRLGKSLYQKGRIIDEIEKWISYEYYEMSNDITPKDILDKLRELKGSDKE